MADFTIKNLLEIEDASDRDEVEARLGRRFLDSEQLGISHFRYAPNYTSRGGHRHETQEEAYVVVAGSGRIKLDDQVVELRRWDVVRVAPNVVRGFDAGPEGLELIAVGGERPEGGDGVPVADRWITADE